MNSNRMINSINYVVEWFVRLVMVNVLWFFYTLIGIVIGGVFPATVAALSITRKWIDGEHDVKIGDTYKQVFKKEFWTANIIGWVLSILGLILYFNYRVMINYPSRIFFLIPFAFYLLLFFFLIIILWVFPLQAHYQSKWYEHIKNAAILGLTKIHYTIINGLLIFSVIYFSLEYPGIIVFFSIGIIAMSTMWFCMKVFLKLDQNNN